LPVPPHNVMVVVEKPPLIAACSAPSVRNASTPFEASFGSLMRRMNCATEADSASSSASRYSYPDRRKVDARRARPRLANWPDPVPLTRRA
jgi:hypothetical protein